MGIYAQNIAASLCRRNMFKQKTPLVPVGFQCFIEPLQLACGKQISPTMVKGKNWSVQDVVNNSRKCFPGKCMCYSCQKAEYAKVKERALPSAPYDAETEKVIWEGRAQ